ncbi:Tubulinyl-Tyr carboxypeptidase 1 [Sparganum proliferum]
MFQFCCHLYPDYEDQILALMRKDSKDITYPVPPIRSMEKLNSVEKLSAIQSYMSSLQYNYTGTQFFAIPKFRPIIRLVDTAREIIRDSLPIKCLEGVILAVHIVLGIYCRGYFGALGMSRREDLMYKPLEFHCLSDLVGSYLKAYASYEHIVQKLKIGGPIPHEPHMLETIMWRGLSISPVHASEARMSHLIETYSKQLTSSVASPRQVHQLSRQLRTAIEKTLEPESVSAMTQDNGTISARYYEVRRPSRGLQGIHRWAPVPTLRPVRLVSCITVVGIKVK